MSLHLITGTGTTQNWRLPAETNLDDLRARLTLAMQRHEIATVTVEMNNDPLQRTDLVINGGALPQFAIIEIDTEGRVIR